MGPSRRFRSSRRRPDRGPGSRAATSSPGAPNIQGHGHLVSRSAIARGRLGRDARRLHAGLGEDQHLGVDRPRRARLEQRRQVAERAVAPLPEPRLAAGQPRRQSAHERRRSVGRKRAWGPENRTGSVDLCPSTLLSLGPPPGEGPPRGRRHARPSRALYRRSAPGRRARSGRVLVSLHCPGRLLFGVVLGVVHARG